MEAALKIVGWLLMGLAFLVLLGVLVSAAGAPKSVQWAAMGMGFMWSGALFVTGLLVGGLGKLVALAQEQVDLLHDLVERGPEEEASDEIVAASAGEDEVVSAPPPGAAPVRRAAERIEPRIELPVSLN